MESQLEKVSGDMAQEREESIPSWQQIVFGVVLPLLIAHIFGILWLKSGAWQRLVHTGAPEFDLIIGMLVTGFGLLVSAPTILYAVIRTATRPWKRWWSAFGGGMLAVLVGAVCGVVFGAVAIVIVLILAG